jgi:hypothetical protein
MKYYLLILLIAVILCTGCIGSQPDKISYQQENVSGNYVTYGFGHGEGDPLTNHNDTYIYCVNDKCTMRIDPWDPPLENQTVDLDKLEGYK